MNPEEQQVFLKGLTSRFNPVLDTRYAPADYFKLDLSKDNMALKHIDHSSSENLGNFINNLLQTNGKLVAYGGYAEKRSIYDRSTHFNLNSGPSQRNVHLGLDLWAPEGSVVLAPLAGRVHSFKDNMNYGDYGPCLILEHELDGHMFHTLYGHLSRESLKLIELGKVVDPGSTIAYLGSPEVNGDYPSHLHFQIILNIGEYEGDYPGVSSAIDLAYYLDQCPDPNLLLKIN